MDCQRSGSLWLQTRPVTMLLKGQGAESVVPEALRWQPHVWCVHGDMHLQWGPVLCFSRGWECTALLHCEYVPLLLEQWHGPGCHCVGGGLYTVIIADLWANLGDDPEAEDFLYMDMEMDLEWNGNHHKAFSRHCEKKHSDLSNSNPSHPTHCSVAANQLSCSWD